MQIRSSRTTRVRRTRTRARVIDEIAAVAQRQLGLLTREQAVGVGISRSMVEHRLESGIWVIRHPGVYAIAGTPMSWDHKVMAAVLAAGSDALASHLTGAALCRLDEIVRSRIAVTVGGTTALRLRGVDVHRSLVLAPQDRSSIDGIPVMSVACTIVHCTGLLSLGQLARIVDDALVRRLVTITELAETAERLGPAPGRPMKNLRLLIAERGPEADTADSRPEMRLFRVLRAGGLPEPTGQHPVRCGPKKYFIDAAYPDLRLALEYHGFDAHRTRTAFDGDAKRTRHLMAVGWRVLTFTSKDTDADIVQSVRSFVV